MSGQRGPEALFQAAPLWTVNLGLCVLYWINLFSGVISFVYFVFYFFMCSGREKITIHSTTKTISS